MTVTRRKFLESAAVLSGALAIGAGTGGQVLHGLAQGRAAAADEETITHTVCPGGGCHVYCPLKVHVKGGKIVKLEAAEWPGEPENRTACLRGLSSIRWVYAPDRITYPLKRVGERGSGKWERVSWDTALNEIGNKLLEIKGKYGPESVQVKFGGSSSVGNLEARMIATRFANLWGAGGGVPSGWTTDGGYVAGRLFVFNSSTLATDAVDFANSKMVVVWGGNLAESHTRDIKYIMDAREKGAKFVVVGPIYDPTAAKADMWIPVRLATDGALALSMIKVIIDEELYDADYVRKYTVGPLLVRDDNKKYLRESDISATGSDKNFVLWDVTTSSAKAAVPKTPMAANIYPALFGSVTVNGIKCKPAFQLLSYRADEYPLDKAAEITNVPADLIAQFAREYAKSKPACIAIEAGSVRHFHGSMNVRAICTLAGICGNVGVRGGGPGGADARSWPITLNTGAINSPQGAPGQKRIPGAKCEMEGWIAVREGKYPLKGFIGGYRNLFHAYGNAQNYRRIFEQCELNVQIGVVMDMTTEYADYILPDATVYERTDLRTAGDHEVHTPATQLVYMAKAIEPVGECKPNSWIFGELGKRVGFGEHFTKTSDEYIAEMLSSKHSSIEGITLERLKKEGIVRANVPKELKLRFPDKIFPTETSRIEFYSEVLIPLGEELPLHKESLESPRTSPLRTKYPLSLMTKRKRFFTQTSFPNVDWLLAINPEPKVDINPADAQARGIQHNDVVRVFNDRGSCKLKARINSAVPPGLVNIDHGWWIKDFIEGHYNYLLQGIDDPATINPVLVLPVVQADAYAANHTMIYDVLVQVEKA